MVNKECQTNYYISFKSETLTKLMCIERWITISLAIQHASAQSQGLDGILHFWVTIHEPFKLGLRYWTDMLVQLIEALDRIGHQWPWPAFCSQMSSQFFIFPDDKSWIGKVRTLILDMLVLTSGLGWSLLSFTLICFLEWNNAILDFSLPDNNSWTIYGRA